MKAFLLAAGLGTRLRPLTDTIPKCLVPIDGKPLLEWWMNLFARYGVEEVLLNTHYLPEKVRAFLHSYAARDGAVHVREYYEPELLGSGGTVAANRDFVGDDKTFLICYADNLTNADLGELVRFQQERGGILTMALFRTNTPEQCGIAETAPDGRILTFTEKPERPAGNLANAGIYVADRALFEVLPSGGFCDFGKDILPKLVGQMYGFPLREYLIDIGTPENLERARKEWHDYL